MTNSLCMVIFSSAAAAVVVAHLPSLTTTGNHFHFLGERNCSRHFHCAYTLHLLCGAVLCSDCFSFRFLFITVGFLLPRCFVCW